MSADDNADRVLRLMGELQELRKRRTDLDAERAGIEKRIGELVAAIGSEAGSPALIPGWNDRAPETTSEKILLTINRSPGATFTAIDIAALWNDSRRVEAWRTVLSRLCAKGKIRRVIHGRYTAISRSSKK